MNFAHLLHAIFAVMSPTEIAATIFGLVSVWLTVRENIWCWPTGLVMVVLYIVVFYRARLYSDMGLQVVYIFMQIYGWYYWIAKKEADEATVKVARLGHRAALGWAAVSVVATVVLGHVMRTYTNASLPYWDATTTVLSIVAQWLMGVKVLESWWIWIFVDVLYVGIYFYKRLYLTTGLYAVFLVLATMGFLAWKKAAAQTSTTGEPQPARA